MDRYEDIVKNETLPPSYVNFSLTQGDASTLAEAKEELAYIQERGSNKTLAEVLEEDYAMDAKKAKFLMEAEPDDFARKKASEGTVLDDFLNNRGMSSWEEYMNEKLWSEYKNNNMYETLTESAQTDILTSFKEQHSAPSFSPKQYI